MKTNSKHTPGPWKIEINNGELEIWSQDTFIAGVTHDLYFTAEKSGQHAANAALIAAAPELLEALENALRLLSVAENNNAFKDCALPLIGQRTIGQIESILDKAKGE